MNTTSLNNIFLSFNNKVIVVIGDVMLDSYLWGSVNRISPEAPVPVVSVNKKENRIGGAANVALNIKKLGAMPIICSVIGNDENGKKFISRLKSNNLVYDNIIIDNNRLTTTKTRIISNNQQIVRVDEETDEQISSIIEEKLLSKIQNTINNYNVDAIIFEDYDKGIISKNLIDNVVSLANKNNILISVDPKKKNFNNYKNITMFKPNFKELIEGLKLDIDKNNIDKLPKLLTNLRNNNNIESVLITLSEKGLIYQTNDSTHKIPAMLRDITDVSGAGDTVISVATLCLCSGVSNENIAKISNIAGGLVCEKVGVVPIDKNQLLDECLSVLT